MGICEARHSKQSANNYPIQHIQTTGNPNTHCYKFGCAEKQVLENIKLNLKFIFYNFRVKFCVSHHPKRNSTYITEIRIGQKLFPLIINKGQSPSIPNSRDIQNGYFEQKEYTISELENTNFFIGIYEFLEDIPNIVNGTLLSLPEDYKKNCNYCSFFQMNLLSFLFKSVKCDFAMMGTKHLSTKTRISFYCFIEHKERITIKAGAINNPKITKLVFQLRDINLQSSTKTPDNSFVITTPPITMLDLQRADIFLESNETYLDYSYISLNNIKADIIRQVGQKIIKEENDFNELNLHKPVDIHSSYINSNHDVNKKYEYNDRNIYNNYYNNGLNFNVINKEQITNNTTFLYFENLPIVTQIINLYFTEYGIIYNTALLNLINNDIEINNFRKSKGFSVDFFYEKLNGYNNGLSKIIYDTNLLDELCNLLMKSADDDKFMSLYPTMESLNKMVVLLMKVGINIIQRIVETNDEFQIILLSRIINLLMKREELDNGVLYECINKFHSSPDNPEKLYNNLIISLIKLYKFLLSNKIPENDDDSLIELFSRLYFQKQYLRKIILSTLKKDKYDLDESYKPYDIFLYDVINDDRLNTYLNSNTLTTIKNFIKSKDYFKSITYDTYKILKKIISFISLGNINQYPLDFSLFADNLYILHIMENDINSQKYEKPNMKKLSNDFYESSMLLSNSYFSISHLNNCIIQATNGHNQTAVYILFIYFKSLFDYYYPLTGSKFVMDYSMLESAIQLLTEKEDSISLPRLFWFYYFCGHMMVTGHLKWFIINIINKKFDKFAYHWSFTIRQVFFKLILFIISDRLKNEEGRFFMKDKLNPFLKHKAYPKIDNFNNAYEVRAFKDFDTIKKEYDEWNKENNNGYFNREYPIFFLPPPNNDNNLD